MRKMYLTMAGLLLVGGMFLVGGTCDGETPNTIGLTYTVTDNGGTVSLEWDEIDGADYYTIAVDGVVIDSTADNTTTTYDVTENNPGKEIVVTAVGTDPLLSGTITFDMVVSSGVKVWSKNDPSPDHPSWVSFDASGNATAVPSSGSTTAAWYMNDAGGESWLATNYEGAGGNNPNLDVGFNVETGPIEDILVAPAPGGYFQDYPHGSSLGSNQFGTFWLDAGADNAIGVGDHFGKFVVTNYNANDGGYPSATSNIYYQSEPMLRWVVD